MSYNKPSIPKGTRDFGPLEMARRNYIFDCIILNIRQLQNKINLLSGCCAGQKQPKTWFLRYILAY